MLFVLMYPVRWAWKRKVKRTRVRRDINHVVQRRARGRDHLWGRGGEIVTAIEIEFVCISWRNACNCLIGFRSGASRTLLLVRWQTMGARTAEHLLLFCGTKNAIQSSFHHYYRNELPINATGCFSTSISLSAWCIAHCSRTDSESTSRKTARTNGKRNTSV